MARPTRWGAIVVLAAMFALAWRHELYLIVIAMPAAAMTLAAHGRVADRCDARRAAALAAVAPNGVADPAAIERVIAADLAAASMGDAATLDRAATLAEQTVTDPWRRVLATERLQAAKHMTSRAAFGEQTPAPRRQRGTGPAAAAIAAATVTAVVVTGNSMLLAPLGLATAALALTLSDLRRSQQLRSLLVRQATTEPATGDLIMSETAITGAIEALTSARPRVRALATSYVATWPEADRRVALRRLEMVQPSPRPISRLDRDVATWGLIAAALTALTEAL